MDIRSIPALGTSGYLFLMATWIVFRVFCFVNEAQCHGGFTKKHLLKDGAVLDLTAAASQTVSK